MFRRLTVTIDSPFAFNSYSYTLLHIVTSSLHAITDVCHRTLLLFNAATHRYILLRNFERKDVVQVSCEVLCPLPVISARLQRTKRWSKQEKVAIIESFKT